MTYSIVLTEQAKVDLIDIFRYIAEKLLSPQAAENQLFRLEEAISSLGFMPERFRVYDLPKWKDRGLRVMPVDHYLVFYIPEQEGTTVSVLRVMYAGRDVGKELDSEA